ncbi:MAG: efflux RND transporter periplasmic adaptor subunit [Nitrospirota bacterium]
MSKKKTFLKIIVPIVIILSGVLIMKILIAIRPEPVKETREDPGILVSVREVKQENIDIVIKGNGTVHASQEISVVPQISGRVTGVSPDLVVGGFFVTDEILFEIEETDYVLALEKARAARAKAAYDLATVESQAGIARAEWERMSSGDKSDPNPLVLFVPQLNNAKAALASAEAGVEQARLDLERTKVRAPFNCKVRSENIDQGQYIRAGSSVAVLAGTDSAEINVPISLDDLRWIDVPEGKDNPVGPPAVVSMTAEGTSHKWHGHVVRTSGEVDPKTRMMQIVVQIADPYGLSKGTSSDRPALALGTFVEVSIKGRPLNNVFVIPRTAFRDNSTIWTMDKENKMKIKHVVPVRMEKESVIVTEGLSSGDMLVLSTVSGAADGMKLRVMK